MGKKSTPTPPPAPDYVGAARETAAADLEAARYQTTANRVDQYTPWGSLTYKQDPSNPDKWTQTETLTPEAQRALDAQLAIQQGRSDQANSMLDRVKNSYAQDFNPTRLNSYLAGINPVDQSSVGRAGAFSSNSPVNTNVAGALAGVQGQIQNAPIASSYTSGIPGVSTSARPYLRNVSAVNQSAPGFNSDLTQGARAAWDSQMALLAPELERARTQQSNALQLQGLNPGSEAFNNASSQLNTDQARQLNSLAASSVMTGNDIANRNYASQLAGFQAGNAAQNQAFGQGMGVFGAENDARTTALNNALAQYKGDLTGLGFMNDARNTAFAQGLQQFQAGNEAQGQNFRQDLAGYQAALEGLRTNAALQQAQNAAQNQAYAQALQNYSTNWQQEQTLRNLPLNELNALLTGQQVANPEFQSYNQQRASGGADILGATNMAGDYASDLYNVQAQQASANRQATASMLGSVAGLGMLKFSDERLKKDIEKVGETEGGTNVYSWEWNKKGKALDSEDAYDWEYSKKGGGKRYLGVIAQENPEATVKHPSGYLMVDYSKIK